MVNWFCSSAFCYNNFRTKAGTIKYYKLPKDLNLQQEYRRILKTDGINFKRGYICGEHWSSGERTNIHVLPDIVVPPSQIVVMNSKIEKLKNRISKMKNAPDDEKKKA